MEWDWEVGAWLSLNCGCDLSLTTGPLLLHLWGKGCSLILTVSFNGIWCGGEGYMLRIPGSEVGSLEHELSLPGPQFPHL
jgi:hypothetical protein